MSAAVPMPRSHQGQEQGQEEMHQHQENDWLLIGAGMTMIAGSILLITKQRRLGLMVTAAGAALAALEHREEIADWWEAMPRHLDKAQHMINQAQETMQSLTEKHDNVMALFGK